MPRGGEEERRQMPCPRDRRLPRLLTLLQFFINQGIKRSTVQYFNTTALKTSSTKQYVLVDSVCIYFFILCFFFLHFAKAQRVIKYFLVYMPNSFEFSTRITTIPFTMFTIKQQRCKNKQKGIILKPYYHIFPISDFSPKCIKGFIGML